MEQAIVEQVAIVVGSILLVFGGYFAFERWYIRRQHRRSLAYKVDERLAASVTVMRTSPREKSNGRTD